MNKVVLTGNLTKDLDVSTGKNFTLGRFTIAVNNGYGENQTTQYIPCSIFGDRVESLQKYLLKGTKVLVDGSIYYENSKDDDDKWKTTFNITVQNIEILKFKEMEEKNNKYSKKGRK